MGKLMFFAILQYEKSDQKKRAAESVADGRKKKKPFASRKRYPKQNPKNTDWYRDYCVDAGETFRNPEHRDGKLFRQRFFHSYEGITSIVEEIEKEGNYFWKQQKDAFGRESHPLRMLVLGAMRILVRNVTLDCDVTNLYRSKWNVNLRRAFFSVTLLHVLGGTSKLRILKFIKDILRRIIQ